MSEWTVPVRNVLFLALPRRAFLLPASLCTRFLGTCFLAGFILVAIGAALLVAPSPASCAAANTQYTVILARAWDCVRLLSALRADATAKKCKSDGGAGSSRYISAGEPKCKGVRFSCERARAWLRPRLRDRRSLRAAPRSVGGNAGRFLRSWFIDRLRRSFGR